MNAAFALAAEPVEPWRASHAPPVELPTFTAAELRAFVQSGEREVDQCEALLAWASRARGAIDVAIGEGLHALRQGDRLARLGCHLDDYAREVLDLGEHTARNLARLGRELPARPLLRAALRAGRVRLRAAETVLAVAVGDAEANWVDRAQRLTVRELEVEVRRARGGGDDEDWLALRVRLRPEERVVVDEALDIAGELLPGSSRAQRLEAMAQEFLAEVATDAGDDGRELDPAFRPLVSGEAPRRAALEAETHRWSTLPHVLPWAAPDVRFAPQGGAGSEAAAPRRSGLDAPATAQEIDARLRELAQMRAGWDDVIGSCARIVKDGGLHRLLGFASFRHYVEERLGLSARTVEERAALERRLSASPALRAAKEQGIRYEKLRLLARLPDHDITRWTTKAKELTCIALRRELEGDRERRMRATGKLGAAMPRRTAVLLNAAIAAIRERSDGMISTGKCLAIVAWHFHETWNRTARPRNTRSLQVRERDLHRCQAPGCSHPGPQSHHVDLRSHGGGDELENQVALCPFHHLFCIHGGYLKVVGRAPDALSWSLLGKPWAGPGRA